MSKHNKSAQSLDNNQVPTSAPVGEAVVHKPEKKNTKKLSKFGGDKNGN